MKRLGELQKKHTDEEDETADENKVRALFIIDNLINKDMINIDRNGASWEWLHIKSWHDLLVLLDHVFHSASHSYQNIDVGYLNTLPAVA